MLNFFFPSVFRIIVGTLLALASFLPIHSACRRLRFDKSTQDKGSPTSTFESALILMVGIILFPVIAIVFPIQWVVYSKFHLLTWRGWLASITAVGVVVLYVELYHWYTLGL